MIGCIWLLGPEGTTHHDGIRGVARGLMVRISVDLVIGERVFFGRMVRWLMVITALLTCI